jgi:hypothetical protein
VGERSGLSRSKDLLKLISEYQMHVLGFVQAFHRRFGVDDFLGAWRRGEVPQRGTLDDQYETRYEFHGVGCHFSSERGDVDFDFGPNGRYDGFDGWRLWILAQSLPTEYPEFQRLEVVESVLGELVTDGIVVRPRWEPSLHLCYLKEDCGDDDIPFTERQPLPFGTT